MNAVLGIDAAWTDGNASGVALARRTTGGWECMAAAPSAGEFLRHAAGDAIDWTKPAAGPLDPGLLLGGAVALLDGEPISCIAVDMPLARAAITGRRVADDAVSAAFGRMKCSTHSPSLVRPGPISERLRRHCERSGFRLATEWNQSPSLIEVYPHPAIVELCGMAERAKYKVSKRRTYWRELSAPERTRRMLLEWERIVAALGGEMAGIDRHFRVPGPETRVRTLKSYEDALDGLVCAWVGVCYLEGRAMPYGDGDAAIWIPAVASEAAQHGPAAR